MKLELESFAEDAASKLRSLRYRLARRKFKFVPAKGVPIAKLDERGRKTGKIRPIVLAPVESRIVQRAILNVLLDVPALEPFIKTKYSFGGIRSAKGANKGEKSPSSLSAVPAAIKAVLDEIENGGRFVACADIRRFFTRIQKSAVTRIISAAVRDDEFVDFFKQAIDVELANLDQLRQHASDFPIEDIGVAQGNSLSPLLGNIVLAEFDERMNEGDCRCIRYIDDFIILAPTKRAVNARLKKAIALLKELGMELSPEKSSSGGFSIGDGFTFLGIQILPGLIRPGPKAQAKFDHALDGVFRESVKSMRGILNGQPFERSKALLATLKRIDGMIDGWGKHYWFCNDHQVFANIDDQIEKKLRNYLGEYRSIRSEADNKHNRALLGVASISSQSRTPFKFPSVKI